MRTTLKVMAILVLFITLSNIAVAKTEIMPLSDIRPGMKGVGKTVLRGTEIEDFNVEVISILKDQQPGQDLILVKTSGDVIKRTGGIASGMSGSPIYIDGKLIGAIGYGWQLADHKIGMVTPIQSMIDIFSLTKHNKDDNKTINLNSPIKIGNKTYNKIYFSSNNKKVKDSDALIARPVSTPLTVSGLNGRAKERLVETFKDYNITPINGGSLAYLDGDTELKPGSAVAAQLVRGDINVSAIGTLTYREGNKILAFGHPFLAKGNSNYLLSSAYIHQMITSIKMPFKIGSPGKLKGVINQDRTAGIAGEIGKFPNVVPLEINVTDNDLARSKTYNLQIIQNEELIEGLASSAVLQAIDSTIDRTGEGTSKVSIEIMGNKVPADIVKVENLYYSPNDIAASSLADFLQGLSLILHNPFNKVDLANIKFNIEIEKDAKVALIEEIKLNKKEAAPGEEVEAEITLRPYRNELITKKVKFKIPEDTKSTNLEVHVFSGQEANLNQMAPQEEEKKSKANNIKTLEELIEVYKSQKKNNQLVVELRPTYTPSADVDNNIKEVNKEHENKEDKKKAIEDKDSREQKKEIFNDLDEEVVDTNYVLEGSLMEEIKVKIEE
ncbi:SpoIVB peptidase S55 domain-containing protein [Orenia marismortui]|uniref:SpoIVB peptidase S55 n=1 Tax=Orenia marismortui TaxID=46469 RepID=A0A4R8HRG3_9FIRM|nr:SpoIVB peptidase S55 domain-containing protein [Orenia marismortui]TDX59187.1 SpoIVB peptidase S55 [Orenia marismortui]